MKVLIVDDEKLTREGLMSSVDWKSLGIYDIILADDGLHGLELAKLHKPEIVLSDVRMPRMDGIQMAERILTFLPDSSIIFMSGYSDKEYLKAAIKLKAISYVEKPLDPLEIEEAVLESIEKNKQINRTKMSETLHSLEKASSLALLLTYPSRDNDDLQESLIDFPIEIKPSMYFTTIIVKFTKRANELRDPFVNEVNKLLKQKLEKYKLEFIHVIKHEQHVVYHIFGTNKPALEILHKTCSFFQSSYEKMGTFFIAMGTTVNDISRTYQSYSAAVILLQSSFFYDYNSVLSNNNETAPASSVFTDPSPSFLEALSSKNRDESLTLLQDICTGFKNNHAFLPNQVKDIYYKLFMALQNTCKKLQINIYAENSGSESILEYLEEFQTLKELHESLCKKTEQFFDALENQIPENSTIYIIKDFIRENYKHDNLSVKDISEHVYLSTSYVCTLFKSETGQTLNQYITEFRMEKAKQLLADPRYKITDISSKIGYTDGNYFSKSFKKIVGLSPSEYREKMIQ